MSVADSVVDRTSSTFTDEELAELALAADPNAPLPDSAVAFAPFVGESPLPNWYMPPVAVHATARWQRRIIYAVVSAFVIIEAFGFCTTFG
jgi:hypothetical protein